MNRKVLGVIVSGIACLGWDLYQRLSVRKNRGLAKGKRLLILGGGFAGVEACRELEHLLPGDDNGEIVLVNRTEYLLFTPMLTEAVGADVEPPPHHRASSLLYKTNKSDSRRCGSYRSKNPPLSPSACRPKKKYRLIIS